ncbi:dead end protein 1 [Pagrus major]|uniref:dead end protein 1 n=1 Tax=Pagrus major TaxID=143350 RepID=UPI003CC8CF9D
MAMINSKLSEVLNIERVKELETWLKTTKTKLTQVNGQRRYGGPPEVWDGPTPGPRCEVFISHIPRDAYEDLLIPLFSSVGPLWEFRLMMNFSGQNRGFAYAKYGSSADATNAIRLLHGHMMEHGYFLSVRRSVEKRHLCLGDLPTCTRQEDLLQVLRVLTEGVERVSLKAGPGIEGVCAIVAFSSHHTASMAKKVLVEAFRRKFALTISITWLSTIKPNLDEPLPALTPSRSLLPSPIKPPRHLLNCPQPSVRPPCLAHHPSTPPGFSRAVGGPTGPRYPPSPGSFTTSSSSQVSPASSASPVRLLRKLCEATGIGHPLYELHYSHTGSDGFLYFSYKVCFPGITMPFEGEVMILPGPSATTVVKEAQQAAANQVLHRVYSMELTP